MNKILSTIAARLAAAGLTAAVSGSLYVVVSRSPITTGNPLAELALVGVCILAPVVVLFADFKNDEGDKP